MTRRFAVGHNPGEDGNLAVARDWRRWRSSNPGGGLVSSVRDQSRWARFHLVDGHEESGALVLPTAVLRQMREPAVELRGGTLGDALGICWFLRDVPGVPTMRHGGSAHDQFAELLMVPERDFAIASLRSAGPNGIPFNQAVVRWALEHYLGLETGTRSRCHTTPPGHASTPGPTRVTPSACHRRSRHRHDSGGRDQTGNPRVVGHGDAAGLSARRQRSAPRRRRRVHPHRRRHEGSGPFSQDDDGTVIGLDLADRPAFRVPRTQADPMTFSDSRR